MTWVCVPALSASGTLPVCRSRTSRPAVEACSGSACASIKLDAKGPQCDDLQTRQCEAHAQHDMCVECCMGSSFMVLM